MVEVVEVQVAQLEVEMVQVVEAEVEVEPVLIRLELVDNEEVHVELKEKPEELLVDIITEEVEVDIR